MLLENKPLIKFVKSLKEKTGNNPVVDDPPTGDALEGLVEQQILAGGKRRTLKDKFDGTIPEDCFMFEYSEADLLAIMEDQQKVIDFLQENGKTKHLANRILFIFDDLVGSSLFNGKRENPFKRLNTNHRHFSASILMVSQAFKEVSLSTP